jgi:hypothetical protein
MYAFGILLVGFSIGIAVSVAGLWWSLRSVDLNPDEPQGFR